MIQTNSMPKSPLIPMRQHELDAVAIWISHNRGKLTQIAAAVSPKVAPQFVTQVLRRHRKSKDGRVERMLREAGAPL